MIPTESIEKVHTTGESAEKEYAALDLLIALARHKIFILKFTVAAVVLAAIVVFLIPNQYTAETLLLPPAQPPSMASTLMSQLGGSALASLAGGGLGLKTPGDMYVSLFRSRTVEDAVINRFGLQKRYGKKLLTDARAKFEDRSTVVLGAKDGLIRITVRDRDPKLAADIANGYVAELQRLSSTLTITEASQRRAFFQQQLQEAKDNLASAEEAMKSTQESTGVLQIDSQARALIESAAALRAQIVAKQVQIQAMRSFATEENPELVTAKQQLSALEAQLSKLSGAGQDTDTGLMVPRGKVPGAGMAYIRKYRDVRYYEAIYELIAKQFEMAKLDEARQGATIQVADIAVPPDKKSSPKRGIILLIVTILAFAIASAWAIVREGLDRAHRSPEQYRKLWTLKDAFRSTTHDRS